MSGREKVPGRDDSTHGKEGEGARLTNMLNVIGLSPTS